MLCAAYAVSIGLLSGCFGGGPPHLRIANFDTQNHTLAITIEHVSGGGNVLQQTYEMQPKEQRNEDGIFNEAGKYETTVSLDGGDERSFFWEVDGIPVAGGFQIIVEQSGSLNDAVIGSP